MKEMENTVKIFPRPAAPPPVVVSDIDGNTCDNEETLISAETGLSQLSKSADGEFKTNKVNKNSSGSSNSSKEKQLKKPKSRVVQSRFRCVSGVNKNNSSGSNSRNGSNGSGSSNSSNSLNCTLSGSVTSLNGNGKNKTVRGAPIKSGIGKSMSNVSKAAGSTGRITTNLTSGTRPKKSTTTLAETRSPYSGRKKANPDDLKLHSTVLAETTFLASTHNLFSTTLVGGVVPGGKKLVGSKRHDAMVAALPELPDISAIRIDSNSSDKIVDMTILSSASEKDSSKESSDGCIRELAHEDLMKGYLRYLQSFYIDAMSEDAFDKQLDDLKTQLVFLDQLTSEKQSEVTELKQKLELLYHDQNVFETYKDQTEELNQLVDGLPASENALHVLTKELEKTLHQVKMENLFVPENHKSYRDKLLEAFKNQINYLAELEDLVEPCSHQVTSTLGILDDLQTNGQRVQQCEREVNQAARLAIQEASLQIVTKHVN